MGASSFSPSPITTTPRIETLSSTKRMASTAAWSALSFSPRPIQRAAAIAPASVTRTSSIAMFRSGACRALTASHPFRCLDPDEVEAARDHGLGGAAESEPESLLLALEHSVLVVEAVEVVGDADRVSRDPLGPPPGDRLRGDPRQLGKPLHELTLLRGERPGELRQDGRIARVAKDPGDPGVRVLDVVDGVLLRPLCSEVDVELHRLVRAMVDEVPARGIHTDVVQELVEKDHIAPPLRHLGLLATLRQVDELVENHLDALRVVAEHPRDCGVPVARAVVVGAQDIDRPVEAAFELVHEVGDIRRAIGRRAVFGAQEDAILLVAVGGRPRPERALLLIRVELREEVGEPLLELALQAEAVEVDPESLERRLDLLQHERHRIALARSEVVDVRTLVAVLRRLLAAPHCLDRRPEPTDLRARVVVVVLALDLVPRQLEKAGKRVAVRAVASRRDGDGAGWIGGDHLDLDALAPAAIPSAVRVAGLEDLRQRGREPLVPEEQVDEARPGDLGALDSFETRGTLRDLGGDLPRRPAPRPREPQRDVGGVVPVLRLCRPLEL